MSELRQGLRSRVKSSGVRIRPARRVLAQIRGAGRQVKERLPSLQTISTVLRRSQGTTVEGLTPEAALNARHNFRMGVLNGVMFTLVDGLMSPTLVLAWFITRLGAPNVLVGLLPALASGGAFLPQLLVASRVQGISLMMPWYKRGGLIRIVALAFLVVATIALAGSPVLLLVAFFFLYGVYCLAGGITTIPWFEMVGKVVSPRRRGSFFGQRSFGGGLLALLAAGPVGAVLSEQLWGLTFPYNFAVLFGVTTLVVTIGITAWLRVREPPAITPAPRTNTRALVRRGLEALKTDTDYRSFLIVRILLALATVSDPFYVVYAKDALGAPAAIVGLYLGALSVASLVSNFFWSPLADRASNRTLTVWTVISVALVPAMALLITTFRGVLNNDLLYPAFALVFVLSGMALGASRIVNNNMLLTIAPPTERGAYLGLLNTVLGVVIFVPVLGGLVVDLLGFIVLFVVSLLLAAVSLFAASRMSARRAE